jgi:hypothetical protein
VASVYRIELHNSFIRHIRFSRNAQSSLGVFRKSGKTSRRPQLHGSQFTRVEISPVIPDLIGNPSRHPLHIPGYAGITVADTVKFADAEHADAGSEVGQVFRDPVTGIGRQAARSMYDRVAHGRR